MHKVVNKPVCLCVKGNQMRARPSLLVVLIAASLIIDLLNSFFCHCFLMQLARRKRHLPKNIRKKSPKKNKQMRSKHKTSKRKQTLSAEKYKLSETLREKIATCMCVRVSVFLAALFVRCSHGLGPRAGVDAVARAPRRDTA